MSFESYSMIMSISHPCDSTTLSFQVIWRSCESSSRSFEVIWKLICGHFWSLCRSAGYHSYLMTPSCHYRSYKWHLRSFEGHQHIPCNCECQFMSLKCHFRSSEGLTSTYKGHFRLLKYNLRSLEGQVSGCTLRSWARQGSFRITWLSLQVI